jgi:hypothetical protein
MRLKHPDIEWRVDDIRNLGLEDACIDVAIDKVYMCVSPACVSTFSLNSTREL